MTSHYVILSIKLYLDAGYGKYIMCNFCWTYPVRGNLSYRGGPPKYPQVLGIPRKSPVYFYHEGPSFGVVYTAGPLRKVALCMTLTIGGAFLLTNHCRMWTIFHYNGLWSQNRILPCHGNCHTAICIDLTVDACHIRTTTTRNVTRATGLALERQCCIIKNRKFF